MNSFLKVCMVSAWITSQGSLVFGGLITSTSQISGPSSVVDFSQFGGSFQHYNGSSRQIGDNLGENITWSSNDNNAVIGDVYYTLGSKGHWDSGRRGFTGTNNQSSSVFMRYDFLDGAVASAGGFINFNPTAGSVLLEAIGTANQVLESYDLQTQRVPSGTNVGHFFGIDLGQNEISALVLRGAYAVLDDLTFGRTTDTPPPPSTIASSREFAIRNGVNGDATGDGITNRLNAEVGNQSGGSSPDVRGVAEFDLNDSQFQSASSVELTFDTILPYLQSNPGPPDQSFDITVEAFYTPPGDSITDFQASSLGSVGQFNTRSENSQAFDVTGYYNQAVSEGQTLGFRLKQTDELGDSRRIGWTYGNFQMNLSYDQETSVVPEPTSIALWGLGSLGIGVVVRRRQQRVTDVAV